MSGISTTQSTIAADLDAYESAMWFTSSYMISMSSVAPLAGRLAMIFSPATMVLLSSAFFAVGALITALAPSFTVFIFGRVLCGIGSGGIMTLCMILVIQLTSKKSRGLWIGLTNARLLFGAQAPLAALAGLGVSLSIPHFTPHSDHKDKNTLQKLASLDYAGAAALCADWKPGGGLEGGRVESSREEVAIVGYERALKVLYTSAAAMCVLVLLMQAGTGWTAPAGGKMEEEDEVVDGVQGREREEV
ncbi:hypothetical protein N0V88_002499 [Collariella sp. IMI 366227]|nr:hypothetical protein N0V88_002499 [Collariella sp. IMI 366227]